MQETISTGRRARTEEQKQLRRRSILDAANSHLCDVGYEAFSMSELGNLAGVVKGTLYLYFESREDVMLALCCEKMVVWGKQLGEVVVSESTDEQFAHCFNDVLRADGILPLLTRLDSAIEHNVSIENLIKAKRMMLHIVSELAQALAPKLNLSFAQTYDAVRSLTFLWLGTAQMGAGLKLESALIAEAPLPEAMLPDNVQQFAAAFTSDQTFITNACRILRSIRGGQ